MTDSKERRGGFTLIEVILALVITGLAVTVVTGGFTTGGQGTAHSKRLSRAVWLAQMKLTEVEIGELAVNLGGEGDFGDDHPEYSWAMETKSDGELEGLYKIKITVQWKERGEERRHSLTRFLYRPQ